VIEFGHSRVPVYRENLDDIVGILYAKDLIELLETPGSEAEKAAAFNLEAILREPFLVPESKKVLELLHEFRATKIHLAIVLDEYGGTAGLITIEDILEEIVGEIQDEYEPEDDAPVVVEIDENSARVDARTHLDDLNDQLNLDLPEDEDYDTVGGFVFAELGHIPEPGETFESHGVKVTVDEAERTKVIAVTVEKLNLQSEIIER
ncbi:MAG: hemolysin family protein, partial [Planctomycetota bacterium]